MICRIDSKISRDICSAHQPNLFPYLGIWEKYWMSDVFVWADDMQFTSGDFQQRFEIVANSGVVKYSIPLKKHKLGMPINQVSLAEGWRDVLIGAIRGSFCKSERADKICDFIAGIYPSSLSDLTLCVIHWLLYNEAIFGKRTMPGLVLSSVLGNKYSCDSTINSATDCIRADCEALGCNVYLAGKSARRYLEMDRMEKVAVLFQNFHPNSFKYAQRYSREEFKPYMSCLDAYLNEADLSSMADEWERQKEEVKRTGHCGLWETA